MKCDRCDKEITENVCELEGDVWEEFAQSDLEMILCETCYNRARIIRMGYSRRFSSPCEKHIHHTQTGG